MYVGYVTLLHAEVVPVHLVNGSNQAEGRIEVQHQGKWGTVCNYFRDLDVGTVVCRQLGYKKVATMYDYPYFGQGSGPVWLQPRCSGNETSLGHCKFWRWGVYDWWCTHEHDAGVVCTNGEWLTYCVWECTAITAAWPCTFTTWERLL